MEFLHEIFNNSIVKRLLNKVEIPNSITDNLSFPNRKYQEEAFKRFLYIFNEDFDEKPSKPFHLMYNMATGSGKTMVMAGLILYLYERGYRNFIFFVNSNNIITKTKDNFLNTFSKKYLFTNKIVINGNEVLIKEVNNFEEADTENINIKFTTIQQLHIDLNNTKENSITFEDFQNRKLALFADEAHHLNASTRQANLLGSWEDTVLNILKQNFDNLLLEFTATLDYNSREIVNKYKEKVLYKYDLKEFREDKYSKEISLLRSHYNENDRILQALILNIYRQELAIDNNINLKPVILFKAKKTIAESEENKRKFHLLIEGLEPNHIQNIANSTSINVVKKAFNYFEKNEISVEDITHKIKHHFKAENCLSANESDTADKKKKEQGLKSDKLLNTLEENTNPIRAIFAVQKLNEGWDVLNLFDIVRLYDGRDSKNNKPGKTTIAEAQLIGRGARYYPFKLTNEQDKFKRKYDDDLSNDLRILEELYYHTHEDSRYITELKTALIETGIYDDEDNYVTKQLELKFDFKETDTYKTGQVFYNKKVEKDFKNITSFDDLGVKSRNIEHYLSSGKGQTTQIFDDKTTIEDLNSGTSLDISLSAIQPHIIRFALSKNPFFNFDKITRYFPNLDSIQNFILSNEYLSGLSITFRGIKDQNRLISNQDYLVAVEKLLQEIEMELKTQITIYEGSDFIHTEIHKVFKNKELKISKYDERVNGQEALVSHEPWYVYNANYGTTEEKDFVDLFSRKFHDMKKKFDNIYLIRNEKELKIYDKQGRAFEPDFVLFCKEKSGEQLFYQVFIEPKGLHLKEHDKWKEEFLIQLRDGKKVLSIHSDKYLLTGVPFYNSQNQNEFFNSFENVLY